jgi:NAD(P) transhydrogenase subunit alpha
MNAAGLTAFALEAHRGRRVRRHGRAVVAGEHCGYKAVLMAANVWPAVMPMMMTAAGTMKAHAC